MSDRLLFGLIVVIWAVAAFIGIGLLLPARNPFGFPFPLPLMLAAGALVVIGLAVLARSWPTPARVALGLATAAIGLIAVAVMVVLLVANPFPPADPRHPVLQLTNAEVGTPYRLDIHTHCGFRWTTINGDPWVPLDGPVSGTGTNVFGFNYTQGTVTLTDRDHAVYVTSTNFTIPLQRLDGPPPNFAPCM